MNNQDFKDEAEFEQYFVQQVKEAGGICKKNNPQKMGKGIPDRLVCFGDSFGIVELKNTHKTGRVTDEQAQRLKKFEDNGIKSFVLDDVKDIPKVIYEIQNYKSYPVKEECVQESCDLPQEKPKRLNFEYGSIISFTDQDYYLALAVDEAMKEFLPEYFKTYKKVAESWQAGLKKWESLEWFFGTDKGMIVKTNLFWKKLTNAGVYCGIIRKDGKPYRKFYRKKKNISDEMDEFIYKDWLQIIDRWLKHRIYLE